MLPFGSAASVWSYVRFADAACCISVATLFVGAAHFVDDFFECEAEQSANHGFQCFQAQHRVFGTKMKEAKAKPPSSRQTLLGVDWEISDSTRGGQTSPIRGCQAGGQAEFYLFVGVLQRGQGIAGTALQAPVFGSAPALGLKPTAAHLPARDLRPSP